MRWTILRTLLEKEVRRHLANRGALALVLLLLVASLLLAVFRGGPAEGAGLTASLRLCFVDYADDSPLVAHLRRSVPDDLAGVIQFRPIDRVLTDRRGTLLYPVGTGAIQLRPPETPGGPVRVWFWYPGGDRGGLAPFEAWFWRSAYAFAVEHGVPTGTAVQPLAGAAFSLTGGMDTRTGLSAALVLFGLFFVCVYLLPSLTCEERERGVLLAQALSPASTAELLAAKFLFYPVLGIALAASLAAVQHPRALATGFFWLALVVTAVGSMGVGLTIATVARTQRAASLGAMSYLMAVSLLLFICQQNAIPFLPWLALEYHGPRMLHAALTGRVEWYHAGNLLAAAVLAAAWVLTAAALFRRRGWQ